MTILARAVYRAAHYLGATALMRACQPSRVPVLMYHGVSAKRIGGVLNCDGKHVCAAEFEAHLAFLKAHYRVIPLGAYAAALAGGVPVPGGAAVVTFDDGYENNYVNAFPLLKRHGIPATIFVTADFVERGEPLWVDRLAAAFAGTRLREWADPSSGTLYPLGTDEGKAACYRAMKARLKLMGPRDHAEALEALLKGIGANSGMPRLFSPLKPEQIREMADSNLVEIGSHGCSHRILTLLDPEETGREITESRERIAALAGRTPLSFAYPNAALNPAVASLVEAAGYSCAVAAGGRLDRPGRGSRFEIARLSLNEDDDRAAVAATLCGLRSLCMEAAGR